MPAWIKIIWLAAFVHIRMVFRAHCCGYNNGNLEVRVSRISVIIPTYNRADFIGETIQSVLDQTRPAWEIIVLDDGSTDDTAQVVAQFGERVTYIYQKNAGETAARSAGFYASRGDFISFLDSDDRMLPHNLETLLGLLEARPDVAVAYGWYCWMDRHGRPVSQEEPKIKGEIPPQLDSPWRGMVVRPSGTTLEGHILPQLALEETMLMGSVLIRRACVEAVGAFDPAVQFQGHWDFFLRLARAGYTYTCCRQGVVVIRLHPGNRGQDKDPMLANRVAILDRLFNVPTLERDLANVRHQAYHNAYIEFARDYYALGNFERGARCLNKALQHGPMSSDDLTSLADTMAHYALAPEVDAPFKFVRDLFEPIHSTAQVRRLRSKVLGSVNATLAFRHHQAGELSRVWRHALRAVAHDWQLWRNRGLMRIGLESLLGQDLVDRLRSRWAPDSPQLLDVAAETTGIFISPHLDDVVLSCGGTLAHLAQRRAKVILVTVFTADRRLGAPLSPLAQQLHQAWGEENLPFELRRQEDKRTADYLGIECRWLDFADAIYRYPELRNSDELFLRQFDPRADPCLELIRDAIWQLINDHSGAVVFAPLGLGYHRDHLVVHQALEEISGMTSAASAYYYYEDYPYAAKNDLHLRLAELDWEAEALTIDIADTLQERVRLIQMHASQLSTVFDDPARVHAEVMAYASRVGTQGKPRERFWQARAGSRRNGAQSTRPGR